MWKRAEPNAQAAGAACASSWSTVRTAVKASQDNLAFLLPFVRGSQFAVEEFGGSAVGADPIAPAEQVVNFVGDD